SLMGSSSNRPVFRRLLAQPLCAFAAFNRTKHSVRRGRWSQKWLPAVGTSTFHDRAPLFGFAPSSLINPRPFFLLCFLGGLLPCNKRCNKRGPDIIFQAI